MLRPAHCCLVTAAILILAGSIFAAQSPSPDRRVIDPLVYKSVHYAFPGEPEAREGTAVPVKQPLGYAPATSSPGALVGVTWYDDQSNGTIGRLINWGTHDSPDTAIVHFSWMYLPGPAFDNRSYRYRPYDLTNSQWGAPVNIQDTSEYGGYVGIDRTNDNRAVVGGHRSAPGKNYTSTFYWDTGPGVGFFTNESAVPDSVESYPQASGGRVLWPKFRYVEGPTDTVLHVIAQQALLDAGDPQAIYYFRRIGADNDPSAYWDYPPYVIDSIYTLSHDIDATDDGKVAITWTANLPCSPADPDTASGYECRQFVQWDNDVYYQISNDYGVTWEPRINVTNYITTEGVSDSFRAFADLSALIDANNDFHVVWNARFWPADANNGGDAGLDRGKLFHWSENAPDIRTVHNFLWDQQVCNGGAWNLNVGKFTVSECNGRLYTVFSQFNDGASGLYDDCATSSQPGFPQGAANGDLWVTVSDDGGYTWDPARNLTNSYTPGCDSVGGSGGPCESDVWPSSAEQGSAVAANPADAVVEVVVPAGGVDNGYYLDVQYIDDPSAGGIVHGEGFWQQANVRWFRLACVQAQQIPNLTVQPDNIEDFVPTCSAASYDVVLTNLGTSEVTYNVVIEEDPSAYSGWLTVEGFSGFVSSGLNNIDTGQVLLNASGVICDFISTYVSGRVIVQSNDPSSPDTIPVEAYFTAGSAECWEPDTLSTTCLSLVTLPNASVGNQGTGKVNMDYVNSGDCDTTADVYLYDGSPFVGWVDGADTVMYFSVYGNSALSEVGFLPLDCGEKTVTPDWEQYTSQVMTRDSSVTLERTTYAPTNPDTCNFVIQELRVYSTDCTTLDAITIGDVIDWDIPADTGNRNGSGWDDNQNLVWQYGAEYDQDDTTECQDNDARYGGMHLVGLFTKDADYNRIYSPFAAFTADNPTYVYNKPYGLDPAEYYTLIDSSPGYSKYASAHPDSQFVDLHMSMAYVHQYTLDVGDTLVVYTALISQENGTESSFVNLSQAADNWACDYAIPSQACFGCCVYAGDFNHDGGVSISDLTALVDFLFRGGPSAPCPDEADADGSGQIAVSDVTYIVDFLFRGGPPPICP